MKIVFVVNTCGLTGGIRVVFKYANGLAQKGHEVSVVHLLKLREGYSGVFIATLKKFKYLVLGLVNKDKIDWYKLDKSVEVKRVYNYKNIPKSNAIFATANETADWVAKLPTEKGKKYYLIQDYENWARDTEHVEATYQLPLKKIVVSPYLKKLVKKKSKDKNIELIENGVDANFFNKEEKKYNEVPTIMLQFHVLEKKGVEIALEAIRKVTKKNCIKIIMFGSYKISGNIENNIEYYFKPEKEKLVELYKRADIFINSSIVEGFGLTVLEAMASGCAVITTPTGIMIDNAIDRVNSLVVESESVDSVSQALEELISGANLRKQLGQEGIKTAKNFSWKKSIDKLESVLKNESN